MSEAASLTSRLRHGMRRPVLAVLRTLPLLTATRRLPPGVLRAVAQIALNRRVAMAPLQYVEASTRFGFRISGDTRDFIQRYIFVFGVWEPNLSEWIVRHLVPGDFVLDVGANVGYFSLLCAQSVGPTGRVIAFEPVAAFASALRRDAERNGLANVIELREVAVSDRRGVTQMYVADASNRGMSSTAVVPGYEEKVTVSVVPAESCVDRLYWRRIRLVKVDVEGDELRALFGMRQLLEGLQEGAAVVVEVAGDRLEARGETVEELMYFMRRLGFDSLTLANDYRPRSYAFHRSEAPEPLVGVPQGHAEVVFIKRDGSIQPQPGRAGPDGRHFSEEGRFQPSGSSGKPGADER